MQAWQRKNMGVQNVERLDALLAHPDTDNILATLLLGKYQGCACLQFWATYYVRRINT